VLQKICSARHFDAKDAGDFADNPFLDEAVHPFGRPNGTQKTTPPSTEAGPSSQQRKRKRSKGTKIPTHSSKNEKFHKHNIPHSIRAIFKKQLKKRKVINNNRQLRNECLNLIGNSLAKSTWNRYNSAFNLWQKFCTEENSNPEKISQNKKILFICWCSKNTNLQTSTISMYLSAINHCLSLLAGGWGRKNYKTGLSRG